jgi:hypothetical protein
MLYRGFPIRRRGQTGTACRLEAGDPAGGSGLTGGSMDEFLEVLGGLAPSISSRVACGLPAQGAQRFAPLARPFQLGDALERRAVPSALALGGLKTGGFHFPERKGLQFADQ